MPTITVRDIKGQSVGEMNLNAGVFEAGANVALMHQAVVAEEANNRQGTADTKTRGEVAGSGKKPWRQKGTGRARQGMRSAPHWRHGGIVFGPHPRDYQKNMPRKMRRAAVKSALTAKLTDGEMIVVDSIALEGISSRQMAGILDNLEASGRILLALEERNDTIIKSARNIAGVHLRIIPNLSARDILNCDFIVITKGAVQKLEEALSK
ncbi:MAG: 50S ribosomal protein L4 [Armatimonadota bacterium]|nr:50S ribosomal protein L4 [Armatimonadota bacterium]